MKEVIKTGSRVFVESQKKDGNYDPFGLTMAGISSKALKANYAENKCKYNDGTELESKEFSEGSGLDLYATEFRGYDPQIGRFHQIDPLSELAESWSPYTFAFDNPILFNDPLGLTPDSTSTKPEKDFINTRGTAPYCQRSYIKIPSKKPQENSQTSTEPASEDPTATPWMQEVLDNTKEIKGVKENYDPTFSIANNGLRYTGLSDPTEYALCSAYATYVINKSGYSAPKTAASRQWTSSNKVVPTDAYYGTIAVFRNYADAKLTKKLNTGHIGFLYGITPDAKYIILGGNQGNTLKFSAFARTSGYIKQIGGYMHLEGFYFPANYSGPRQIAPVYQSSSTLNILFGIISTSNTTR